MFDFFNNPRDSFDIWSPLRTSGLENQAFSAYCKHKQECEDVISLVRQGCTNIQLEEELDSSDLEYISKQLREYGIEANLNFK